MEICEINSGKDETLCERYVLCNFCLSLSPRPSSAILSSETHKPKYGKFCEVNSGKYETLCEGMYFVTCVSHCEKPKLC